MCVKGVPPALKSPAWPADIPGRRARIEKGKRFASRTLLAQNTPGIFRTVNIPGGHVLSGRRGQPHWQSAESGQAGQLASRLGKRVKDNKMFNEVNVG